MSRIVSEGLIGKVDSGHTQKNDSAPLWRIPCPSVCSEEASWSCRHCHILFWPFQRTCASNTKISANQETYFLFISSQCLFADKFTAAISLLTCNLSVAVI